MKLAQPSSAPTLSKPKLYPFAVGFAAVIAIATVALLFFLDKVIDFTMVHTAGGSGVAMVLLTAVSGVFSLPYLLRMDVSPFMRIASCVAMFATVAGWMLGLWWLEINTSAPYVSIGLVGVYTALVWAVGSVWVIGSPILALKKRS